MSDDLIKKYKPITAWQRMKHLKREIVEGDEEEEGDKEEDIGGRGGCVTRKSARPSMLSTVYPSSSHSSAMSLPSTTTTPSCPPSFPPPAPPPSPSPSVDRDTLVV